MLLKVLLLLFPFLSSCYANRIDMSHRACTTKDDCKIVTTACGCIHNSTCAGPEDQKQGWIDAVNVQNFDRYKNLSDCTAAEKNQCSTAGACASRGAWIAECQKAKCVPVYVPRN